MKSKNLSLVMYLMMGLFIAGCNDNDKETGSAKVGDVSNSSCLRESRAESVWGNPMLTLTREGNNLYCQLTNYKVNCAFGDVQVYCKEQGLVLNISVDEGLGEVVSNCICPINISFTIFDALQEQYQLNLNGRAIGYVSFNGHTKAMVDLNTLAVAYDEGFQYSLKAVDFHFDELTSQQQASDAPSFTLYNSIDLHQLMVIFKDFRLPSEFSFYEATVEEDEEGAMVINFLSDGAPSADSKRLANMFLTIVNYKEKTYHLRVLQSVGKKDADDRFVGEQAECLYEGDITIGHTDNPITISLK